MTSDFFGKAYASEAVARLAGMLENHTQLAIDLVSCLSALLQFTSNFTASEGAALCTATASFLFLCMKGSYLMSAVSL